MSYLSQFWDLITAATGETIEWFQSVGNAVAGAMGGILISLIHPAIDGILVLFYMFKLLGKILDYVWIIPRFLYNIFHSFISGFTTNVTQTYLFDAWTNPLQYIPFWNTIGMVTGIVLTFKIFAYTRKEVSKVI